MNRTAWIGTAAFVAAASVAAGYWLGMRDATQAPSPLAQGAVAGAEQGVKNGRKIRFYRNPMGLPDTSPVPKKDPMGMDYVPVYEGDEPEPDMPAGTVKIRLDKVQILGVRSESAEPREPARTIPHGPRPTRRPEIGGCRENPSRLPPRPLAAPSTVVTR
jgi:Cu(I)/Ag(I) efflux system membrane fusion protein